MLQHLADYTHRHPAEVATAAALRAFLRRTPHQNYYRRTNFDGHITASAFVLDPRAGTVLLIHHAALDRWLQPGGHVDPGDVTVLAAALREVREEVGIPATHLRALGATDVWLDVDSYAIPANPRKAEPAHVHHDLRYAFVYDGPARALATEAHAVNAYRWCPLPEAARLPGFSRVIAKCAGLASAL